MIALVAVPFMVVPLFLSRDMDILLQGEKRALELGVEVERTKRLLLITAGVLTAIAVSVSGIIGFVGLVVPHIVRLVVGPSHRTLAARLAAGRRLHDEHRRPALAHRPVAERDPRRRGDDLRRRAAVRLPAPQGQGLSARLCQRPRGRRGSSSIASFRSLERMRRA